MEKLKITRRGKIVRAIAIILLLVAMYKVAGHFWWVGDHYCWGDMLTCYGLDK